MSVPERAVQQPNNIRLWVRVGAKKGLLLAGRIGLCYLFTIFSVILLIIMLTTSVNTNILVFLLMVLSIGLVVGVIPALIIGSASGAVIGMLSAQPFIEPHWGRRVLVGVGTAIVGIGVLSGSLLPFTEGSDGMKVYFFWFVGLPSLFYLYSCIHISTDLPTLVEEAQNRHEVPIDELAYLPIEAR